MSDRGSLFSSMKLADHRRDSAYSASKVRSNKGILCTAVHCRHQSCPEAREPIMRPQRLITSEAQILR